MASLNTAHKTLIIYGLIMVLAMVPTYIWSKLDSRTIREVGVWVKPMKFMAAMALFAITTAWLMLISEVSSEANSSLKWIAILIVSTSSFEVGYITLQAIIGEASHYNTSDLLHTVMCALMGLFAVCLTASQAILAWVIWTHNSNSTASVTLIGITVGLILTFVLATVSGFLLGGNQPPQGMGLPIVGWHFYKDIRPSHFLGVHAQQFIPAFGLLADRFLGQSAFVGFSAMTIGYLLAWASLTWAGLMRS